MAGSVPAPKNRDNPRLWPREHGAYVSLLAPLLSALLFAPTQPGLAWAVGAFALFVSHEPLLVLLGQRGLRAQRAWARAARVRLVACATLVALATALTVAVGTGRTLAALMIVAVACGAALVLVVLDYEKTLWGELLSTTALLSLSLPVLALAGIQARGALLFATGWLLAHGMATLTARAYVYRKRDGGRLLDWAACVSLTAVAGCAVLYARDVLSFSFSTVPWPFALVTAVLWSGAYRPRSPKGVGWSLTAANVMTMALLGLSLGRPF